MDQTIHIAAAQPAPPCTVVIFGASGDLAKRKLIPALYNLRACGAEAGHQDFGVVGFARRPMSVEKFREDARDWASRYSRLELDRQCWNDFAPSLDYVPGLDQPDGFKRLKERLERLEAERHLPPNRIYYLSVPPEAVPECVERLAAADLIAHRGAANFTRVVLEKPIGHDLVSALELNRLACHYFDESQIFRIDHYLGKETVRNLLVLRFANAIFERMWGARNVDHVQITVAESEGVGARAMYYDPAGALRDMVQNHILQLLSADRDGPAGVARRGRHPRGQAQRAARHPAAQTRRRPQLDYPGPLHQRHDRGRGGSRLYGGAWHSADLAHRDFRRGQDLYR